MKNHKSPKLRMLIGKTVYDVGVSTSHGELLEITFTDGTTLQVCSPVGTVVEDSSQPDEILVDIDGVAI